MMPRTRSRPLAPRRRLGLALGCLAALLALSLAACSRDLPTGGNSVPLNVQMRVAPEIQMGSLAASIDSVRIRVYDTGDPRDLLVASATVVPDTTTAAFVASFGVPYATRYRVSAAVFGVRARRSDPLDVTDYGVQLYGESAVDAGLGGFGDVWIDLLDVVPVGVIDSLEVLSWHPIRYAASYDVFDAFGNITTVTDTLLTIGSQFYRVRANLYDGTQAAYSEPIVNSFRTLPRP